MNQHDLSDDMKKNFLILILLIPLSLFAAPTVIKDPENQRLQWMLRWDLQNPRFTGKGTVVAVLDSGIDSKSDFFKVRLLPGINTVDQNFDTTDSDDHGTPVAGIISQLAIDAKILAIKVAHRGSSQRSNLLQGLVYALKSGADVINISLNPDESLLQEALEFVGPHIFYQSLIVVSSGNWGEPLARTSRVWENIMVVGATLLHEEPIGATYSNYGEGVDIMAPAGGAKDGISTFSIHGNLRLFNGTSAAAPVVSGVAALVKEKFPQATGAELKSWLLQNACPFDGLKSFAQEGRLVNMAALYRSKPECSHFK